MVLRRKPIALVRCDLFLTANADINSGHQNSVCRAMYGFPPRFIDINLPENKIFYIVRHSVSPKKNRPEQCRGGRDNQTGSAIRQIIQIVSGRAVPLGAKIFASRTIDDLDFGILTTVPWHEILMRSGLDIVDRISPISRRPAGAIIAKLGNIAVAVLAGFVNVTLAYIISYFSRRVVPGLDFPCFVVTNRSEIALR